MKAITLWQPWATLIVLGEKKYETRSWAPPAALVGATIAVHAAKKMVYPGEVTQLNALARGKIEEALNRHGLSWLKLPTGAVLGGAVLDSVWGTDPLFHTKRYGLTPVEGKFTGPCRAVKHLERNQESFGDYSKGRYAWELKDAYAYPEPIPAKGKQKIWNWEGN